MQELRDEIVAYLRNQMRSNMERRQRAPASDYRRAVEARAFALGTAADALESAILKGKS